MNVRLFQTNPGLVCTCLSAGSVTRSYCLQAGRRKTRGALYPHLEVKVYPHLEVKVVFSWSSRRIIENPQDVFLQVPKNHQKSRVLSRTKSWNIIKKASKIQKRHSFHFKTSPSSAARPKMPPRRWATCRRKRPSVCGWNRRRLESTDRSPSVGSSWDDLESTRPFGNFTVCYWTWPFIVDLIIKNGDSIMLV